MNILYIPGCPTAALSGLLKGDLLRLAGRRGQRISSRRGTLWLTQDGDPDDIVLGPGESHTLDADGPVLIQALDRASVSVQPPTPMRPGRRARWRGAWPLRLSPWGAA